MLTKSVMTLVFVHREKITYGSLLTNGADEPKSYDMVLGIKCHRDELFRNE